MNRFVTREILDTLPPDDRLSPRLRRDLARVNFWMGNRQTMTAALKSRFNGRAPKQIVELGAGDGSFLLRVAEKTKWQNVNAVLLDRQKVVTPETLAFFSRFNWRAETVTADVSQWPDNGIADAVIANLFLHHFEDAELASLLQKISERTNYFVAIEPCRLPFASWLNPLFPLIGCHPITRHDAVASIRAGFIGDEISRLWPDKQKWQLSERRAGIFSHLFVAKKIF